MDLDQELVDLDSSGKIDFKLGGCTANVSFIDHKDQILYVANAGDARCLVANRGSKDFE